MEDNSKFPKMGGWVTSFVKTDKTPIEIWKNPFGFGVIWMFIKIWIFVENEKRFVKTFVQKFDQLHSSVYVGNCGFSLKRLISSKTFCSLRYELFLFDHLFESVWRYFRSRFFVFIFKIHIYIYWNAIFLIANFFWTRLTIINPFQTFLFTVSSGTW